MQAAPAASGNEVLPEEPEILAVVPKPKTKEELQHQAVKDAGEKQQPLCEEKAAGAVVFKSYIRFVKIFKSLEVSSHLPEEANAGEQKSSSSSGLGEKEDRAEPHCNVVSSLLEDLLSRVAIATTREEDKAPAAATAVIEVIDLTEEEEEEDFVDVGGPSPQCSAMAAVAAENEEEEEEDRVDENNNVDRAKLDADSRAIDAILVLLAFFLLLFGETIRFVFCRIRTATASMTTRTTKLWWTWSGTERTTSPVILLRQPPLLLKAQQQRIGRGLRRRRTRRGGRTRPGSRGRGRRTRRRRRKQRHLRKSFW